MVSIIKHVFQSACELTVDILIQERRENAQRELEVRESMREVFMVEDAMIRGPLDCLNACVETAGKTINSVLDKTQDPEFVARTLAPGVGTIMGGVGGLVLERLAVKSVKEEILKREFIGEEMADTIEKYLSPPSVGYAIKKGAQAGEKAGEIVGEAYLYMLTRPELESEYDPSQENL